MNRILNAHLLPEMADPHALAGHTSVVIDVLRASTTITTALAYGASRIIPCLAVEEARQLSKQRAGSLLGGERQGKPIQGFDFGNSPAEYVPERVTGKTIVFTTTNGTKAMTRCMGSARILVGAIVNREALCRQLTTDQRVDLLCAGTNGEFSMDDALGAGAMVDWLTTDSSGWQLNDGAEICRSLWQQNVGRSGDPQRIVASLEKSMGGRNLMRIGMGSDLSLAGELDRFDCVPNLDKSVWELR